MSLDDLTELINKMKDEILERKEKSRNTEQRCSMLLKEIQAVVKESDRKSKGKEELRSINQDLASYLATIEKAQDVSYYGKPLHEA